MKVLNVCVNLDPVNGGGVIERTFQMSLYLARAGVECTILTTDMGLTTERIEALKGVNLIALPCVNKRFYIPKFSYSIIRNAVKKADIIHLVNHWTLQNAIVYFIARYLKKPYVLCPAGSLSIYGRSKILKVIYNLIIGKRIISNADVCIAITRDEIPHFIQHGVKEEKIIILPNGISRKELMVKDDDKFRSKFNLGSAPIILFFGRLNHIKGPDLLLEAFCNLKDKLRDYQLVFVGPDEGMLSMLKEIVAKNNIDRRVHFLGFLGGEDKSLAYHASELLVIPSRQEAMSIVVLEAGITETPVLITDQCGMDEVDLVKGGKVVPANIKGLEQALLGMLSDRDGLKAMGKNLKMFVVHRFLWENIVNDYIKLYKSILHGKEVILCLDKK